MAFNFGTMLLVGLTNSVLSITTAIGIFMIAVFLVVLVIMCFLDTKEEVVVVEEEESRKHYDLMVKRRKKLMENFSTIVDIPITEENAQDYEQNLYLHGIKLLSDEATLSLYTNVKCGNVKNAYLKFGKWKEVGEKNIRLVNLNISYSENDSLENALFENKKTPKEYSYHGVFLQEYTVNNTKAYMLYQSDEPTIYQDIHLFENKSEDNADNVNNESNTSEKTEGFNPRVVLFSKKIKNNSDTKDSKLIDEGLYLNIYDYNNELNYWDMITYYGEKIVDFTYKKPESIQIEKLLNAYILTVTTKDGISSQRISVGMADYPYTVDYSKKIHEVNKIPKLTHEFSLILGLKSHSTGTLRTINLVSENKMIKCYEKQGGIVHNINNCPFVISEYKEFVATKDLNPKFVDNIENVYEDVSYKTVLTSRKATDFLDEEIIIKNMNSDEDVLSEFSLEDTNYISEHFISYNKKKFMRDSNNNSKQDMSVHFSEIYEMNKWDEAEKSNRIFWNYTIKNEIQDEVLNEFNELKELYDRREYENKRQHEARLLTTEYVQKYHVDASNFMVKHSKGRVNLVLPVLTKEVIQTENTDRTIVKTLEEVNFQATLPVDYTGHDDLVMPFEEIKKAIKTAKDAISSPDGNLLLVLTDEYLEIYVKGKKFNLKSPIIKINLTPDEEIISKEWARQEAVKNIPEIMEKIEACYRTKFKENNKKIVKLLK